MLNCLNIRLCDMLWTVVHQAPLSMEFSRQEYWSGLPCPPPGHLPNPETEPTSLVSPALAGRFFTTRATWEAWIREGESLNIQYNKRTPILLLTVD